jgi:phosphoglycerate dehydrogenase-like enzyme
MAEAAGRAEVLWYQWDPRELGAVVERCPELRWVSTVSAGVDRWPLELLRARGITLTNGTGLGAVPIAEHILMVVLAAAHGLPVHLRHQLAGRWERSAVGGELSGSTALVLGYGAIGRAAGERLRAFGVRVVGVRREACGEPDVLGAGEWRPWLGKADWVVLALPLTALTLHVIGPAELASMKPGCWLVNVGRGGLVDEAALVSELQRGRLGGAALDVFEQEPLPPSSPLWVLPNVILTPHVSGYSDQLWRRGALAFEENLQRYGAGQPLLNVVDLSAGY